MKWATTEDKSHNEEGYAKWGSQWLPSVFVGFNTCVALLENRQVLRDKDQLPVLVLVEASFKLRVLSLPLYAKRYNLDIYHTSLFRNFALLSK